jgi:SAM-dependent methyltransferase
VAEPISLASFSAVDIEPDAAALIAALDEQASIPAIQRLRATAIEMAGIRTGSRVVRALAATVGANGWVVGIDQSDTMLTEARRRGAIGLPLEFRAGNVTALNGDGTFDAALCERVLQHVHHPESALAELVRVTRPGGRVVATDTDWGMLGPVIRRREGALGVDQSPHPQVRRHEPGRISPPPTGGEPPGMASRPGVAHDPVASGLDGRRSECR